MTNTKKSGYLKADMKNGVQYLEDLYDEDSCESIEVMKIQDFIKEVCEGDFEGCIYTIFDASDEDYIEEIESCFGAASAYAYITYSDAAYALAEREFQLKQILNIIKVRK